MIRNPHITPPECLRNAPRRAARVFGWLFALGALLIPGCQSDTSNSDQPEIVWRFAIEETSGSVQDAYAQQFKKLVEQRSEGRIRVKIYPYGTLGTSDHITEQLHLNVIQFAMASPGHVGKLIPEVQVFLLHFLFTDNPVVNSQALRDPELRAFLDQLYAEKGFKFLSIFSEGWQVWTLTSAALGGRNEFRGLRDFAGLKIRVMTSPLLVAAYNAYNANPTPLPYGEVYSALQLSMIDAQVNPIFAIEEMNFHEVTDWLIFGRHSPFITTVATNTKFYQSLSSRERSLVDGIVREMDGYILEKVRAFNQERLEIIKEDRPDLNIVPELSDKQRQAFREASLPVHEAFVEQTGPDAAKLLELLKSALNEAEQNQNENGPERNDANRK